MDCLSVLNPSRLFISSLNVSLSFSFLFPFFYLSFFHSSLTFSFSLPQMWLYEKLKLTHPPLVPSNQYQPKHYSDRRLKDKEMDPTKLTELLKCLTSLDVQ